MKDKVLQFLRDNPLKVHSPTEIGVALGKDYNQASSSVSGALKALEKEGLISKLKVGRIVNYKIN